MPDNPNNWIAEMNRLPPEFGGVLMAIVISILRVIYDRKETKPLRILLEAGICGALSLSVTYGIYALGLNANWAVFAGGAVGYIGSQTIRELTVRLLNSKIDDK